MHRHKIGARRLQNLHEQTVIKSFASEQETLIFSCSEPCDTELANVVKMYSEDLDSVKVKGQLLLLSQTAVTGF